MSSKVIFSRFHRSRWIIAVLILLSLGTGCSTIQEQSFASFSSSLQELRKGADEALKYNDTANRKRFIEETAKATLTADGAEDISNLLIQSVEGKPFAWQMNQIPLFMVSVQFRSGVYSLNSTLVSYSQLLASLANSDLVSQTEFDTMAKELNANLKGAASTLGFTGKDEGVAIFSAAASRAAHAYIDSKRKSKLREALEENQHLIVDISAMLQRAIRIAVLNLRQDYDQRSITIARQLGPNKSIKLTTRKKTVEALVELNENYLKRLKILESLSNSYRSLPAAHLELIKAIEKPGYNLMAVQTIYENGKHMYQLYKEMQLEKE